MTPQQKFDRIQNPKSLKDYGLSLSESELRQFPAGRELLLGVRLHQRSTLKGMRIMRRMGRSMGLTMDRIAKQVFSGGS